MLRTSQNVHRRNRRKLGAGQFPAIPQAVPTVTTTGGTNMTLTFDVPVVVKGTILTTLNTRTLVSQTVVSQTVVTQVWSGAVAGLDWTVPAGDPAVATFQGGALAG